MGALAYSSTFSFNIFYTSNHVLMHVEYEKRLNGN